MYIGLKSAVCFGVFEGAGYTKGLYRGVYGHARFRAEAFRIRASEASV